MSGDGSGRAARAGGDGFSYTAVGMTAPGGAGPQPPPGYHRLRLTAVLGAGEHTLAAAGAALLEWRMHRAAGLRVRAGGPAAPGVRADLRLGPLRAPCRVVWAVTAPDRIGFGYGTLVGHPERGEEAFWVARGRDGVVRLTILAYSEPAARVLRLVGPLGRAGQRLVARRYAYGLRRCLRRAAGER